MKIFVALGLVGGFAYGAGTAWRAAWSPQTSPRYRPHYGSDGIILWGLAWAGCGCLMMTIIGNIYHKIKRRYIINTAERVWRSEEAEWMVWPPQIRRAGRQGVEDDNHT